MGELGRGLVIVGVGILGTFGILAVIMSVISLNGRLFGKTIRKPDVAAPKSAGDPPVTKP
jgi:hypothetical protein